MCGAQQTTGTATAYITKGTKIYSVKADLGGVFKQVKAPTQAGDLLYGVTSITFKKPAMGLNSTATATEADSVKDALAGVGSKVTAIDPNAPVPRCIPARVITFYRGNKEAASVTTMCSADSGSTTGTLYSADDKTVGRLTLDMTKIGKVEARLRWTR